VGEHIPWAVEISKDGERWRFFGKGWALPGEALLLHGVPRLVRYRRSDQDGDWSRPMDRTGDEPMTLLHLDEGIREDLWPGEEHVGLPVLLPGGETGRLLRFEHAADGSSWRWALEFRGSRER
jgi:hypothetical protein